MQRCFGMPKHDLWVFFGVLSAFWWLPVAFSARVPGPLPDVAADVEGMDFGDGRWAAYVLASPSRASFVGVTPLAEDGLARTLAAHNGEMGVGPPVSLPGRPWRLAAVAEFAKKEEAEQVAGGVSKANGLRARIAVLRRLRVGVGETHHSAPRFNPRAALDGPTYAVVEFEHPHDAQKCAEVRALVDSGSTDCDLRRGLIKALSLPVDAGSGAAHFETAAGVTIETPIHQARIRVAGREALVRVSPMDEEGMDDGGFSTNTDDALLGHDALAALGLLVDCRNRRLIAAPDE